eukprot:GDKI01029268.1.p1 GENE.GDKI01029268.1~~GDKI01029268.1.p1  ORF type:complete len:178 (-),score=62.14 GDKI01029268.1:169-702(-)
MSKMSSPSQFLNGLSRAECVDVLIKCCHSKRWANAMADKHPFGTQEELEALADSVWWSLGESDFLEAFLGHPKIGDVDSLRTKFAATAHLCAGEQAGSNSATEDVLQELKQRNEEYEKRHGFIFIVCATGKSAGEMLAILKGRLPNSRETELHTAAGEQAKITKLRLQKLGVPPASI